MNSKFLLALSFVLFLSFTSFEKLNAQSKEELQELLSSETRTQTKSSKWDKQKKKKTEKQPEQAKEEPKKEEKKAEPKREEAKPVEQATEKKEEPKPLPAAEVVKEEPKSQPKVEPKKEEPKAAEPVAAKKEEPKAEPKKEAKKEEPKPAQSAAKKEEPKAEPKKEVKKEEPKPAQPVAAKKEEPKPQPKKEETKPVQQPAAKKEEPKAEPKKEVVKEEPKKEEPKPAPVVEQKKEEPKPIEQAAAIKEEPKPEPKKVATTTTTSNQQLQGEKLKDFPEPDKIGFGRDKRIGKKLFKRGSIENSMRYFGAALSKKPKKTKLNQNLADGNFMLRDYVNSNSYYKKIVDLDSVKHKNLNALYQYALTEKYLGRYENARDNFQKFIKLAKDNEKFDDQRRMAGRESQGCDLGISLRDNKDVPEFKITHLNENVNQPLTEFSPTLRDDNTLYYGAWTSDRVVMVNKHEHYADFSRIYVSQRNGDTWTKGALIAGGVNESSSHVGNATISADGETMYYTQCLQDDYQRMRCDIYKSKLENNTWSAGTKLDSKVNAEGFTSTHPALGRNEAGEDVLYFSSDRNTGRGMDLFCAKINADGSMSKARSVGPAINTKGDEITPGYDFKTNTLYFSSNGQINIGGADVYKINASGGEWGQPQHLGMPINSSVDDMYFSWSDFDGEGYLVSNRGGGFGTKSETCCDDIYKVEKSHLNLAIEGVVQNMDSSMKAIDNALVTLYSVAEGKELKNAYATNGKYFFDLEKESDYQLVARKKGFEDYMKGISTKGKRQNDTMSFDFPMKMLPQVLSAVGTKIGTVYWEFNKDYLTDGAPDTLNRVVGFMTDNPQYVLEVGSHTDAKGTEEYNLKLAQRRSDAVLKYLASKKIAKFRLESKAYGETNPVELNENPPGTDNPEGRTKNRRTEFVVTQELTQQQIDDAVKAEKEAKSKPKKATAPATPKAESKTSSAKPAEKKTEVKPAEKK